MKLEVVPLTLVSFQDDTFFIGQEGDITSLKDSIREVGLINPPILRRVGEKYQIICGRKRLKACKELGFGEALSKTYQAGQISEGECLKLIFHDNKERLGDMERAELLLKFRDICGLDETELRRRALPYLGISPSRKNFEKYIRLAQLGSEIKDAFYSEKITLEQLLLLSETKNPNREEILERVLLQIKLNTNETREVVKEIQEVSLRDKKSIGEIMDEIELKSVGKELKSSFRRELKRMRYPMLTGIEEEFRDCLKSLSLPKEVNVFHPPFFEGNYLEIRMRIESTERLSEVISSFASAIEDGKIDRAFSIIKEGKLSSRDNP